MSTTLTIYSQAHLWITLPLPQFLVLWFSRQAHVDAGDFNVISCFNSSMCSYKNMYTELGILRSSNPTCKSGYNWLVLGILEVNDFAFTDAIAESIR